jgi:hypothetical protein
MSIQAYKTAITITSATLADLGTGLTTGHERTEPDGRMYVLLFCGEATPDGMVVCVDETETTATVIHSELCLDGTTKMPAGVNNTGAPITDNHFWWALKRGLGYGITATTDTKGLAVTQAALGEVTTATLGTDSVSGILLETGVDSTQKAVYWTIP